MDHADLLYWGCLTAAGILSVWTAALLTATLVALAPSFGTKPRTSFRTKFQSTFRKFAPGAATISSTRNHGTEEPTPPRPLSEALPQRSRLGRALRFTE
jgi:hypothetical protein